MDLWSHAGRWGHSETPPEAEARPSLVVATAMWATVLLPYVGLALLAGWGYAVGVSRLDLAVLAVSYLAVGFGVTIGYHRLLAHRAFNTYRWVETLFLILGAMAAQGPPVRWAATHRRHHQRSDHAGDPHSPHAHHGGPDAGLFRGFWHAHTGWLLRPDPPDVARSVGDLLASPVVRFVDRWYGLWIALGFALPFALGWAVKGSVVGGLVTAFWGTALRIGLMHHATWSVNSVCHLFGYRSYTSGDHSRNNPVVALLSLGEGWHNNHHAFPTSARHGLRWYEVDLSYLLIRGMEAARLAWDVRRPSGTARRVKAIVSQPLGGPEREPAVSV